MNALHNLQLSEGCGSDACSSVMIKHSLFECIFNKAIDDIMNTSLNELNVFLYTGLFIMSWRKTGNIHSFITKQYSYMHYIQRYVFFKS